MQAKKKKIVYVEQPPSGLFYIPEFLTPEEEAGLLEHISIEAFEPFNHQGFIAKREIVFYGLQGGYKGRDSEGVQPVPEWLQPLRHRCANLIGLSEDELEMALVAHYPIGAGIGWHRDAPPFGPTVLGVSFRSDAQMRFRRFVGEQEELFRINLERGSAYVMSGPSRSEWQHGMNPVTQLRYSITFRTVKKSDKFIKNDPRHDPVNIAEHLAGLQIPHNVQSRLPSSDSPVQLSLFDQRH